MKLLTRALETPLAPPHPQRLAADAEHARELDLAVRVLEALHHLAHVRLYGERRPALDAHRALDRAQQILVIERLDQVVDRAGAQRADGAVERGGAGDPDERQVRPLRGQGPDDVEAGAVRQPWN